MEYIDNPEANFESFRDGFYYTGDKAYEDEDGFSGLWAGTMMLLNPRATVSGRSKWKARFSNTPLSRSSAVVGSPDLIRGLIVKAFIVLKPGFEPSENLAKEIKAHARRTTAPHASAPRAIEFVPDLPKTISGKIKRNVLREQEMKKVQVNGEK